MIGSEANNIVKFSNHDLVNSEHGDSRLRTFVNEGAAIQYSIANGDENRTYAIVENPDSGKFEVWEMGNPNLSMNEGQIGSGDEFRKWWPYYEDAYGYISTIGAGASYFGIVDDGAGGFEIWYIADTQTA